MLAFSGRFDPVVLRQTLNCEVNDETAEAPDGLQFSQEQRRRLQHQKAEAVARFKEGQQLARYREDFRRRAQFQPASYGQDKATYTSRQVELLRQYDSNELLIAMNNAIVGAGHGRLRRPCGEFLDIGGSTGGGSRRIIDGWMPPDFQAFLEQWTEDDFLEH